MADPTFAEQMVAKYEALLLEATGLKSVSVAGQMVTYDDLQTQYDLWKGRVAREQGTRPRILSAELGGV
jgi:hypothetical protein